MKELHYGWLVCLGCALLLFCTSGLAINAFTVYQPYILEQNGFSNAQSSAIITARSLSSLIAMILTGKYYEKLSLRFGMALAGLLAVSGFALFGLASTHAVYCVAGILVGLGYGFGTMIPVAMVLKRWFASGLTFAIGICSAVTGLSTLGIPSLITWSIETHGLACTFLAEAALVALLVVLGIALIRDCPQQKGLNPYGCNSMMDDAGQAARRAKDGGAASGLEKRDWLILAPALLLLGAVTNVGYSHLAVLVSTEGFSAQVTALAITASGIALTLGKCAFGWVSDRAGTYRSTWFFGAMLVVGVVLCCCVSRSETTLFAAMCLYGAGLATTTVGLTAWASDLSEPERYDANVRRFQIGYSAGALVFSPLPGVLADLFGGSYVPSYALFAGFTVFVVAVVQCVYRRSGVVAKTGMPMKPGSTLRVSCNLSCFNNARKRRGSCGYQG